MNHWLSALEQGLVKDVTAPVKNGDNELILLAEFVDRVFFSATLEMDLLHFEQSQNTSYDLLVKSVTKQFFMKAVEESFKAKQLNAKMGSELIFICYLDGEKLTEKRKFKAMTHIQVMPDNNEKLRILTIVDAEG